MTLNLLSYGESYVFTFPCAYLRCMLTVPWIELGGRVSITCASTGYNASVTFHTKVSLFLYNFLRILDVKLVFPKVLYKSRFILSVGIRGLQSLPSDVYSLLAALPSIACEK